jgi:hypothetical protein
MSGLLRIAASLIAMTLAATASAQDFHSSTPAARRQIQAFGACVADRSTAKAAQLLSMDFRSAAYHPALRALNLNNLDCSRLMPRRSGAHSSSLLFAGALAERLIATDAEPLNVRLAQAAARTAPPTYGPGDAIANCVVRSAPNETGNLFGTEVGSDAEAQAMKALDVAVQLCSRGKAPFQANVEGLRAILATAAFRNVRPSQMAEKK